MRFLLLLCRSKRLLCLHLFTFEHIICYCSLSSSSSIFIWESNAVVSLFYLHSVRSSFCLPKPHWWVIAKINVRTIDFNFVHCFSISLCIVDIWNPLSFFLLTAHVMLDPCKSQTCLKDTILTISCSWALTNCMFGRSLLFRSWVNWTDLCAKKLFINFASKERCLVSWK